MSYIKFLFSLVSWKVILILYFTCVIFITLPVRREWEKKFKESSTHLKEVAYFPTSKIGLTVQDIDSNSTQSIL